MGSARNCSSRKPASSATSRSRSRGPSRPQVGSGGPPAEVEVAGAAVVVGRADGLQHLLEPIGPSVRVAVEVAVASSPDALDHVVRRVGEVFDAERSQRLEPPLRPVELDALDLELDPARIQSERRNPGKTWIAAMTGVDPGSRWQSLRGARRMREAT